MTSGFRPALLTLVGALNLVIGAIGVLFASTLLVDQLSGADGGVTTFAGLELVGAASHLVAAPLLVLLAAGQLMLGVGILRRHPWVRGAWTVYWVGGGVLLALTQLIGGASNLDVVSGLATSLAIGGVGWVLLVFDPAPAESPS